MMPFCILIALGLFRSSSLFWCLVIEATPNIMNTSHFYLFKMMEKVNISMFMEIIKCRCFALVLSSDSLMKIKNHVYLYYRDDVQFIWTFILFPPALYFLRWGGVSGSIFRNIVYFSKNVFVMTICQTVTFKEIKLRCQKFKCSDQCTLRCS